VINSHPLYRLSYRGIVEARQFNGRRQGSQAATLLESQAPRIQGQERALSLEEILGRPGFETMTACGGTLP
jgi:hypothetical protein